MKKILILFIITANAALNLNAQFITPAELSPYLENPPEIISRAAVLIDAHTGTLLYSKNPDAEIPPASLTKLMTMHLVFKEIDQGRASFDELIPITSESWAQSQPPRSSLMFLEPGQIVTLREILTGLAVVSGNDAAVAAALRLAPSVKDFAAMMTAEARSMGLSVTRFTEPAGVFPDNMTTAAEYALFCRQYIMQHPYALKDFHSVQEFAYPVAANMPPGSQRRANTIVQNNQNVLLRTFPGVDGLKTGFINESGYNIALTAERNLTRFILVVLGAPSARGGNLIRAEDSRRLLSWAFDNFKTVRPEIINIESVQLWKGREKTAELKLDGSADFTSHINRANVLKYEVVIPQPLIAPLPEGYNAGYLYITDSQGELSRVPLVTVRSCEKGNIFKRLWHSILLLFRK